MNRLKSFVVYALCCGLQVQALAQSTLIQEPPFTASEPPPNVMLMFDDSNSMGAHRLPPPSWVTPVAAGTTTVITGLGPDAANTWIQRNWTIDVNDDFMLRAPAINPLWYNPAIRYLPWNKDGVMLPNASIGGSTPGANHGAATSRADAGQLTERDPRQVPTSTGYVAVSSVAGRGLLGTVPTVPVTQPVDGRRVTASSPNVDIRYYKMPFDFGPAPAAQPTRAHANQAWTTHDDINSPLDLFSRPVLSTPGVTTCTPTTVDVPTPRNGCFANQAACQNIGTSPAAQVTTTVWNRPNCANVNQVFPSNPGSLTCYRSRCPTGTSSSWTPFEPTQRSLTCDFQYADCSGTTVTTPTAPATTSCGWRRPGCDGSFTGLGAVANAGSDPGSLSCFRTRSCSAPVPGFGAWSIGAAPAGGTCYSRQNCSGVLQVFTTNPGSLSCGFTRQNCFGVVENFATNPGSLTCWQRQNCAGTNVISTTDPGPLACGFRRTNCAGTVENFGTDPGPLTCYSRTNCDGTTTSGSSTPLPTISCAQGDSVPVTYTATTSVRNSTPVVRNASTFQRLVNSQGSQSATLVPLVNSVTRTSIAPGTIVANRLTQLNEQQQRNAVSSSTTACPTGTSQQSCSVNVPTTTNVCTTGPAAFGPDAGALTPARYYTYTGTGSRTDSASYRVVQIDRMAPSARRYPVVDAVTGVAATAATSARTDCADRTSCTWTEEAQNFANWFLYYRNRMFAAQAVMSDAMSGLTSVSQQQVRLGYGRINYYAGGLDPWRAAAGTTISSAAAVDGFTNPGALVRGVRPFVLGTPERNQFFDWLHSQAWAGATPNREALDSVGRYFSWTDSRGPGGATPGTASTLTQVACRRNFAFLTTDGEWTNFTVGQPLITSPGPLSGSGNPTDAARVNGPAIDGAGLNAGTQFTYRPGDWPQYTGGASETQTLSDVATYYWNRDLRPDLPNVISPSTDANRPNPAFWQSMSTFVVGYGLSASMDTAATRALISSGASVTWPSVDTSSSIASGGNRINDTFRAAMASRGNFYAATSLPELRNGILSTFAQLSFRQGSAGGIAVTGPVVNAESLAFFPSYVTGNWSGSLRAFASTNLGTLAAGGAVNPVWTASAPAANLRNILTSTAARSAVSFQAANLSAAQQTTLTGSTYTAANLVDYLRGDTSLELPASGVTAGTQFRRRLGTFGDFVNSAPVYVRAPNYGYAALPGIGSTYAAYVNGRRSGTTGATVYIGGNGGMFHAFAADTGVERFAYVPRGVYADLPSLASPGYVHRYFVDGQTTHGDYHDGTNWRSVVVGSTGAGGASVFAIDTTNPTSVGTSSVLWDLTKADNIHIGNIMGRGVIGRIRTGTGTNDYRWVYINGNGYESNSNRAALLVVGLSDGVVNAIPVGPTWTSTDGAALRNGMGPPTVRYDAQRNIVGVYAGDKRGQLWRFDFSTGIPTTASGFGGGTDALFTATDSLGNRQPITSAPRLTGHPRGGLYVVFGTGKLIDTEDASSTAIQTLYGVWEKPNHSTSITRSATTIQTLSSTTSAAGVQSFDISGVNWSTRLGWAYDLPAGERIVADPSLELGQLSMASFRPNSIEDPCEGGGSSNLFRLNMASGQVVIAATPGTVSLLTPVVSLSSSSRTLGSADLGGSLRQGGLVAPPDPNAPPAQPSTCTLYGTAIQGRPWVIAQACPPFAPLRVWRQPLR